jgi:hypothetical protein
MHSAAHTPLCCGPTSHTIRAIPSLSVRGAHFAPLQPLTCLSAALLCLWCTGPVTLSFSSSSNLTQDALKQLRVRAFVLSILICSPLLFHPSKLRLGFVLMSSNPTGIEPHPAPPTPSDATPALPASNMTNPVAPMEIADAAPLPIPEHPPAELVAQRAVLQQQPQQQLLPVARLVPAAPSVQPHEQPPQPPQPQQQSQQPGQYDVALQCQWWLAHAAAHYSQARQLGMTVSQPPSAHASHGEEKKREIEWNTPDA